MLFRSNDTATTEIYTDYYTLSLHDALPIFAVDRTPHRNMADSLKPRAFLPQRRRAAKRRRHRPLPSAIRMRQTRPHRHG